MGQQCSVPDRCVIRLGSWFVPGVRQEILRFAQDDRRGLRMTGGTEGPQDDRASSG